jgi:hypothetical protein
VSFRPLAAVEQYKRILSKKLLEESMVEQPRMRRDEADLRSESMFVSESCAAQKGLRLILFLFGKRNSNTVCNM